MSIKDDICGSRQRRIEERIGEDEDEVDESRE